MNSRASETVELLLPADFDEYGWEVEAKGYFDGARVRLSGRTFRVTFYDPVRLAQDIGAEMTEGFCLMPTNLIVVETVTRAAMRGAVEGLAQRGEFLALVADDTP